jgi:hypothetical protein
MTLEEAEAIARGRTADEPAEDWLASWRRTRPRPEPARKQRSLDTMPQPAQEVDVAFVIRAALKAERSVMSEIVGGALGEYGNQLADELLGQVERMIAATAAELRDEFSRQIDQLRAELSGRIDSTQTHGAAQLDEIIAKRRRARTAAKPNGNGSTLLLPAPALADASLARTNGDGRQQ